MAANIPVGQFPLGQLAITPAAHAAFEKTGEKVIGFLTRHHNDDWGEVDEGDQAYNAWAVLHASRLLSAYRLSDGTEFWIITEADRSATTILLPSDY
jgi:hypothetical protein